MDVMFALSVIFTGIVIVFIVLIVLIAIMMLMGKLAGNNSTPREDNSGTKAAAPPPPPPAPKAEAPRMAVQSGIGGEVVAAIAAAVFSATNGTGNVTSITRAPGKRAPASGGRSAWSLAGLRENTSSF